MERNLNKSRDLLRPGLTGRWTVISLVLSLFVFSCMFACQGSAQTTTGTISGTVTDSTGSVIANAAITVTGVQTGISQSTQSNASGNYIFPALATGDYTLSAKAPGFGTQTLSGLHLDVSQNLNASVQLKLGTENQSVTVTSSAALVELRGSQ